MPPLETAQAHESKLYSELAYLYDIVFTRIFSERIQATIRSLNIESGAKVLEVGVGTGLSFEAYPTDCQVTGIDLAPDMLDKARDKIARNRWRHLRVVEMDALNLKFEDNYFDYAMAFHVVSVVPDAERLMREVTRVTKPGARIVIINHFRSRNRFLAFLDRLSEPITRKLGWHTLSLDEVISGVPFQAEKVYKTTRRSLFTIVVGRNTK
ncbi:MAG TPA: methyltransferase domain-containing protein [Candidatus Acidoferrales bacterium]|nr:methyltransferase domain-containing protein [Candidatus Acidoferrales bacterium]